MEISNDESMALPIEVKVITTQPEEIIDQPLVPKSKSDFTNEEQPK